MADVIEVPKVRCDNCGVTANKAKRFSDKWEQPHHWGSVKVSPTNYGHNYPNNIGMTDLCGRCLQLVHEAVGKALERGRKPVDNDDSAP